MNSKILVTYTSQAGSTRGIAEAIAAVLKENRLPVDCLAMKEVLSLDGYDAVIAGSAVHGGKWLSEAMRFLTAFQAEFNRQRVFAFYVGMALTMKSMQGQDTSDCLGPIRRIARVEDERGFAGVIDLDKLPFFPERLVVKGIVSSGLWQAGDHRDWDGVRAWGQGIASRLAGNQAA